MIYSGNLIKINGNIIEGITSYVVIRKKHWRDAERNMAGEVRATLIGIFPEIELDIKVSSQDQAQALVLLLDQPYLNVEWFDIATGETHTAQYFVDEYNVDMLFKDRGLYKPTKIKLSPVSKR